MRWMQLMRTKAVHCCEGEPNITLRWIHRLTPNHFQLRLLYRMNKWIIVWIHNSQAQKRHISKLWQIEKLRTQFSNSKKLSYNSYSTLVNFASDFSCYAPDNLNVLKFTLMSTPKDINRMTNFGAYSPRNDESNVHTKK